MFKTKKIFTTETLGETLSQAREKRGINLKEAEKITRIPVKYLLALEQGRYDLLPGELYIKNYFRSYSQFLGLDAEKIFDQYTEELAIHQKTAPKNAPSVSPSKINVTPKLIKRILTGGIILALFIFLIFTLKQITKPPELIVDFPPEKFTTKENFIEISGRTEKEATLLINNQAIYPDSQGQFKKTLDLNPGLNIIKIQASKKHGAANTVYREVIVE